MVFVEGIAGQAFGDLGWRWSSRCWPRPAVALFFIPMLASRTVTAVRGGVRLGFFETGSWLRLRDWRAGLSAGARDPAHPALRGALPRAVPRALRAPGLERDAQGLVRAAARFQDPQRAQHASCNWSWPLVLPYVARWIGLAIGYQVGVLRRVWAELREDFRASALWVKIAALPFWLVRAVLSLPLPHVLIPWPWLFLFNSGSWARVRDDFRNRSTLGRGLSVFLVVPLVYLAAATADRGAVRGSGLAAHADLSVGVLVVVALFVSLGRVLGCPRRAVRLTDWCMGGLNRLYPRLLRSALARPAWWSSSCWAASGSPGRSCAAWTASCCPRCTRASSPSRSHFPVGTPLEETEAVVAPIERAILTEKEQHRVADPDRGLRLGQLPALRRGRAHGPLQGPAGRVQPRRRDGAGGHRPAARASSRAFPISRPASCGRCCSAPRRRSRSRSTATTCAS